MEKFIEYLANLLKKEPPYLIFLLISSVLVLLSIMFDRYFDQTWIFLLYSIGGTIWRHAEKDVRNNVLTSKSIKTVSLVIYQVVNLAGFIFLFTYLLNLGLVGLIDISGG